MKSFYLLRISAALLLVLFLSSYLPAQTNISGTVSGTWTLSGSPYVIIGDAFVATGNNLVIEPGVSVLFNGSYVLEIQGCLAASGTQQDSIEFRNQGGTSKGIHLINCQDTCRMKYCKFLYFFECTYQPNRKGGALYASNSKLVIDRCSFRQNHIATWHDGYGGAVCLELCSGYIQNSQFISNKVENWIDPGDNYGKGGGIYNEGNVEIRNNIIRGNILEISSASDYACGSYAYGGGIYTDGEVRNNIVQNNICKTYSSSEAYSVSESKGGGIYGGSMVENNLISGDSCIIETEDFLATGYCAGGGIYDATEAMNNTIIGNNLTSIGNGLHELWGSGGASIMEIYNCIIYNNTGAPQLPEGNVVSYSCIQGGYPGTGNISSDPLFVSGPDGEYYLSQLAAGQSQQSPCVEAGGTTWLLLQGTTRTDNFPDMGIIDIGYHYPSLYQVVERLNLKVMLQGAFTGTAMQTNLNNLDYLPLAQPYQGYPWSYTGSEAVVTIPNNNIVDWVLIELRQSPSAVQALPGTLLCRQAGFVDNIGNITGLNGWQPLNLNSQRMIDPGNKLFAVVWHRNHLGVLSAGPLEHSGALYSYDFTSGANKAFGGINGHVEVGQGVWGMISGDGNTDGQVNNADKLEVWQLQSGTSGYKSGDYNLDGTVDNPDKLDRWLPNGGKSRQVGLTYLGAVPVVLTSSVVIMTDSTATGGGNVTTQGMFPVLARGVCWSTSPFPTLGDPHSLDGSGTGSYISQLTGLATNHTYYIRAYATNLVGTSYGNQVSILVATLPEVVTSVITNITGGTATGGGEVISEGGHQVTARGVCWSESGNPTLNDPHTINGSGIGVFISQIMGLNAMALYYVRAYATNQAGTAYGNEVTFTTLNTCPGIPSIEYEGQVYNVVMIGTQCWLKENLNVGERIDASQWQTNNGVMEKYCYDNDTANCTIYGGMYQWDEMMQYSTQQGVKGICPTGWHLPTDIEWTTLVDYLGGALVAGGKMKEAGTVHWVPSNVGATNESGFTALPGGYCEPPLTSPQFGWLGHHGNFRSSTENGNYSWDRRLESGSTYVYRINGSKSGGHSVRCIKNLYPFVSTSPITNIGSITATGGGNVTLQGLYPVIARGVCWSTSQNPTLSDPHTVNGSGLGAFVSQLTGLTPGTVYYVRAYATNITGSSYGGQVSFLTLNDLPVVNTNPLTSIGDTMATSGGNVVIEGTYPVTARGVCWSIVQNPSLSDPHSTDGGGPGVFISELLGLSPLTTYYVRAYATNAWGTSYGNQVEFTTVLHPCPGSVSVIYEGQLYKTVLIGSQCWLRDNLNVGTMIPGSQQPVNNGIIEKYCYNNNPNNCMVYGGLYKWDEMMQYTNIPGAQGICPEGWHIPTNSELSLLVSFLNGDLVAGGKMKEVGTLHWSPPNTGATNESDFTALPGGERSASVTFNDIYTHAFFWKSSQYSQQEAYRYSIGYTSASIFSATSSIWGYAYSVRCLKD